MSNRSLPSLNGTCPCRCCQRAALRTPAQREIAKRRKRIDHAVHQMMTQMRQK